jgi:hypothetical protein
LSERNNNNKKKEKEKKKKKIIMPAIRHVSGMADQYGSLGYWKWCWCC